MNSSEFTLKSFLADEAGYDLVEFALAAALASSVAVVALRDKGGDVSNFFTAIVHGF
jgi:Flp pilus assembly pilin Flp